MTVTLDNVTHARIKTAAASLQFLAIAHDVPIPEEHRAMSLVQAEAARVVRELAPAPFPIPTDPAKVSAAVTKAAADRALVRESRAIAEELAAEAEREAARIMYDLRPTILKAVADNFDTALETLGTLLQTAPLAITSETGHDRAAEHVELLRTVDTLNALTGARVRLAEIDGEDTRATPNLWYILDPKPEAQLADIRGVLNLAHPLDLAGWVSVHSVGAHVAGLDEAEQRAARFTNAQWHAGMATPDGGIGERTYAQALELARQAAR